MSSLFFDDNILMNHEKINYCLFLIVETIVSLHKIRVIIKRRKGAQGLTVRPLGSS